ncbi:Cystatin domain [Dillenia turbinata]|uniref:Cystatin domain n=1 Tax=Dillenia turbinata TaxID=194707 RepID=A0AAN8UKC7_9MAGN
MAASGGGGRLGGRTEIKDVKSNKEIQDLGKYSVEEYNSRKSSKNREQLTFSAVVKAEKQVVSGIKYYLTIEATQKDGVLKSFDAVVVVKPWIKSKQLLRFVPSTN